MNLGTRKWRFGLSILLAALTICAEISLAFAEGGDRSSPWEELPQRDREDKTISTPSLFDSPDVQPIDPKDLKKLMEGGGHWTGNGGGGVVCYNDPLYQMPPQFKMDHLKAFSNSDLWNYAQATLAGIHRDNKNTTSFPQIVSVSILDRYEMKALNAMRGTYGPVATFRMNDWLAMDVGHRVRKQLAHPEFIYFKTVRGQIKAYDYEPIVPKIGESENQYVDRLIRDYIQPNFKDFAEYLVPAIQQVRRTPVFASTPLPLTMDYGHINGDKGLGPKCLIFQLAIYGTRGNGDPLFVIDNSILQVMRERLTPEGFVFQMALLQLHEAIYLMARRLGEGTSENSRQILKFLTNQLVYDLWRYHDKHNLEYGFKTYLRDLGLNHYARLDCPYRCGEIPERATCQSIKCRNSCISDRIYEMREELNIPETFLSPEVLEHFLISQDRTYLNLKLQQTIPEFFRGKIRMVPMLLSEYNEKEDAFVWVVDSIKAYIDSQLVFSDFEQAQQCGRGLKGSLFQQACEKIDQWLAGTLDDSVLNLRTEDMQRLFTPATLNCCKELEREVKSVSRPFYIKAQEYCRQLGHGN